jgi:beta-glucanase (GH16 family)
MYKFLFVFIFLPLVNFCSSFNNIPASATTPTPTPTLPPPMPVGQKGDWQLLFNDEFEQETIDKSKWTTCYWWGNDGCTNAGNHELEWYRPENVLVDQGSLKLQARPQTIDASDENTYDYTSGMITSGRSSSETSLPPNFAFQYGYVEIRAKVPAGQGLWPAFWMLPATHQSKPEIDVMEILGDEPQTLHMYFHYLDKDGSADQDGTSWTGPDFSKDWHTFAVDWQPEAITWYVDGVERKRYDEITHVPAEPMYLLANLAVGGDWPGPPDRSTLFPSNYEIDYIRVWRREDRTYLNPMADAFVDGSAPAANFGSDSALYVDGTPVKMSYLKFDTRSLAGKTLVTATLRIKTTADPDASSTGIQTVKLIDDVAWQERELNYYNRPPVPSEIMLGSITATEPNTAYDIPLDISLLQSQIGDFLTLAIVSPDGDGLYLSSKEDGFNGPQLFITTLQFSAFLP